MQAVLKNSSISNREEMVKQMQEMSQPNPQQQQMQQNSVMLDMRVKNADANLKEAQAEKARVDAQIAPVEAKARVISAVSNNLDENQEAVDFERRMKLADAMLKEKDIDSNERIAKMQVMSKLASSNQSNRASGM